MTTIILQRDNLTATQDGDHIIFEGGKHGMHSIYAPEWDDKRMDRIEAHWMGYCENNGQDYDAIEATIEAQPSSGFQFETIAELHAKISTEYQAALARAKEAFPITRAEPTLLMMKDGERHGDPIWYTGKLTKKLIEQTLAGNDIDELWYANDIDGADNMQDMYEYNDYTPAQETAELLIWKK